MKLGKNKLNKKFSRIVPGILIMLVILSGLAAVFTNEETTEKKEIQASEIVTAGDFRLTADNRWDETVKRNYAQLDWDDIANLTQTGYKLYQSEDGTTWNNRSLSYGKSIKVLNVYPDRAESNTLKGWMEGLNLHAPDGTDLIQVTPVTISNYNLNPNSHLQNASGEYQYDVIMFGSWDSNNARDISQSAAEATINFIDSGRGVLFGHDTVYKAPFTDAKENWWRYFHDGQKDYLGVGHDANMEYVTHATYNGLIMMDYWTGSEEVKIINDGYLMKYPFEMQNELVLTIPYSHNIELSNKNIGTTWAEFVNPSGSYPNTPYDDNNWRGGWYLKTNDNVAMIQTGHRGGTSTEDERKIIANVLYNLAQVSVENDATDYTVLDDQSPEAPEMVIRCGNEESLNIRLSSQDNGKEYQFKVEADTKDQGLLTSDIVRETITSNIAGYFYEVSNSPASNLAADVEAKKDAYGRIDPDEFDLYIAPNDDSVKYETATSFTLSEKNTSGKYVHVLAVDRANNVSAVTSQQIKDITQPVDFEIERTGNEAKLVELAVDATMDNKMKSIEVQIPKNTEIKDFSSLTLPADWYSFENSETTDYYSFSFAMETNNSAATIQTFLEGLRFTIKNSVNTSGSIKIILHEEAYTYWIDPGGTRHYYAFIPEVHTWMEAYNRAKTMSYRGLTGYLATLTSEQEHDFVYDNIGKTFGWLGGTRLRMTIPSAKRIDDESYISPNIAHYTFAVGTASDWYWANGPEAGTVFFDKPTFAEGGKSPVGVYNGFNNPDNYSASPSHEPNNNLNNECVLQFAQANETKYWNDVVYDGIYSGGTVVAGFYIEFSEYGGQTEGEEITDVCWNAAIPQKISLKAYDEQGTAVTDGDLLFDQQLRLDQTITVQPKSLEFYSFVELRETDDRPRGTGYTVSATYQEGKAIYSLRKAILHVRQVVMKPSNELVVPTEGYIEIENRLFNSGNPVIDPTYQANTIVNSGKNADNPTFTNFILTTKPLTDDSDQMVIQPVIPSFYEYLGHYVTTEAASHQSNTTITAGPAILNRGTIDANNELWLTIYLQPNQTADGENITPQPYSWDYKKNDLGKIKTQ